MAEEDFDKLGAETPSVRDRQVEELETQLQKSSDKCSEERFLFVVAFAIMVDLAFFPGMETWSAPLAILALELVVLLVLADRLGVKIMAVWLDKILHTVRPRLPKGEKQGPGQ